MYTVRLTLTLNDGSVLKDATVESNARFLTDGAQKEDVDTVVIVNGTVTASGINQIAGDCGSGSLTGQTALQVNGTLVIPSGSVLTAIGGGDVNYAPGQKGGIGVYLNNGVISGGGKLIAEGGIGNDGPGGDANAGTGKIQTEELQSTGGDSQKIINKQYAGGDAVGANVIVTTENPVLKGGSGDPDGTAVVTLTKDPDAQNPDKNEPGTEEPGTNVPGKPHTDKNVTKNEGNNSNNKTAAVQAGDGTDALLWFVLCGGAGFAAAVIIGGRKKAVWDR